MHQQAVRVVYDNQPYLVSLRDDGSVDRAYGPFSPGTEPNLNECGPAREIQDATLLRSLEQLLPISPALPSHEDTLSGTM